MPEVVPLLKIWKTAILMLVACACLPQAARAQRLYQGEYIAWRIEEHDGYSWRAMDALRTDSQLRTHCELESMWPDYPTCNDGKKRIGQRQDQGVNPFVSRAYRVSPTLGHRYRVIIKNTTACRMAVTLEIDGKNSINSRDVQRSSSDTAWVIGGYETISVEGFQSGMDSAMGFYWTTPEDAYSDRTDKMGTILMHVYFEDDACARDRLINECGHSLDKQSSAEFGTGAGDEIHNPVRKVRFDDITGCPLETVQVAYSDRAPDYAPYQSCACAGSVYNGSWPTTPPAPAPVPQTPAPRPDNCYPGLGVLVADNSYAGAQVVDVYANSPAQRAGLANGDKLIKVGNATVNTTADLKSSLSGMAAGTVFEIQYIRGGSKNRASVTMDYVCP